MASTTTSTASSTASRQIDAWIRLLRVHAATTRQFNAELVAEHGLTLNDFDVLAQLSNAPDAMLRRVDLAERVLLTASGITRLLEGLERAGYVCKQTCASDARVSYAQLTDEGAAKLSDAAKTHLRGIDELFTGRYSGSELATLAELLSRLPTTGSACKSAAPPCS
jgi:DNA-binding MarR family transcriptional regulator